MTGEVINPSSPLAATDVGLRRVPVPGRGYRAVDQYGQVIDVLVSARRDTGAARRFFRRALSTLKVTPTPPRSTPACPTS